MQRRALLATLAATTTATAGCVGTLDSAQPTDTESSTPASTSADTTTATCTVDDSLGLVDVEVPGDPTEAAARDLAEFVEEAYARDRAEADGWNVQGVDYATAESQPADDGAYASVEVSLDASESAERAGDSETTVLADLYYAAWYHVTATRVERSAADGGEDPPDYGWATIACA
ncbi:hypothetical protein [Halorubellus litoreus]|uniref:Uncharacterized protein n=1 Tax=Halorubellus litoreus TaxID=755308 RepID=A0ABD5VCR3_9EURY